MNYLEILKKFDKAIVTESQKLQEIYDNLVKDGQASNQVCNEEEKEGCCNDKPVTEETDEDKQMCEYSEAELAENKITPAEFFGAEEQNIREEKLTSAKDFFEGIDDVDDKEEDTTPVSKDTAPVPPTEDTTPVSKDTAPVPPTTDGDDKVVTEVTDEQRQAIDASSLFQEDKDEPAPEEDKPEDAEQEDKPKNAEQEDKPEDAEQEEDTKCPKCGQDPCVCDEITTQKVNEQTLKDWLDESDKENADEEKSTTPKTSQAATEDTEPTLKESIHNINAFVEAHKRLFG